MSNAEKNTVRELPQTFAAPAAVPTDRLGPGSKREHRVKVFKSGNSLALRLPKALGLAAGMEMELAAAEDGGYSLKPVGMPKRKFNIDAIWGIGKEWGLQYIKPEDRVFQERPLLWDDPEWRAKDMPDE